MMEGAVRRMTRIHGLDRITQSVDPALRSVRCHENLGRVVANLLDNALHATPGVDSVHVFATLENGWIRLVVQDRGTGISDEALAEAFRPGFSTRSEEGGLGIGLSVSREIVEALGGTIELTPDPRGGRKKRPSAGVRPAVIAATTVSAATTAAAIAPRAGSRLRTTVQYKSHAYDGASSTAWT